MRLRYKILIGVVALTASFVLGRYTLPEKVKIVIKTVEVEKKDTKTDTKQNTHKVITRTETTSPTGEKKVVTVIDYDKTSDKKTDSKETDSKNTDTKEQITRGSDKVTISALGGLDLHNGTPVFGGSVTKPVLGPVTIGVWGLSNTSGGASVGLQF